MDGNHSACSVPGPCYGIEAGIFQIRDRSEGVTSIVDVYMRYLRRKLDEPFDPQSRQYGTDHLRAHVRPVGRMSLSTPGRGSRFRINFPRGVARGAYGAGGGR
ncbi:MAG: hypothetical protein ACRETK_14200 [Steroidobacteraceae bacterium]